MPRMPKVPKMPRIVECAFSAIDLVYDYTYRNTGSNDNSTKPSRSEMRVRVVNKLKYKKFLN